MTAWQKREEAFALASITHYCFVETKTNCAPHRETGRAPDEDEAKKWTRRSQLNLLGGRHMVTPIMIPTRFQVAGSARAAAL